MTDIALSVPAVRRPWTRAWIGASLLLAAVVVALVLFWPSGDGTSSAGRVQIPQRVITQAEQEREAWANVAQLVAAHQQRASLCRMGRPC